MSVTSYNIREDEMPSQMRLLLEQYPREAWEEHPNFKEATAQWLGAHELFRRLTSNITENTEAFLNNDLSEFDYAKRLSYRGNTLVGNLQAHHGWEDYEYFPELSSADPRFDIGLEILENDHEVLDKVLFDFADSAQKLLREIAQGELKSKSEAGKIHQMILAIDTLLKRHLSDEEELAVPIILHHKLRG